MRGWLSETGIPVSRASEKVRIKIRSIRPHHSAQFRIDSNARKVGGVLQRFEPSSKTEMRREIDQTFGTILKTEVQAIVGQGGSGNDVFQDSYPQGSCVPLAPGFNA